MASEDDPTIFPDDDFDDSLISSSSSDDSEPPPPPQPLIHHSAVTVAITPPPPQLFLPPPISSSAVSAAATPDSRRLFQRLWTDEDEIELLQGFLDFTASRGGATASGHYHDTGAFYDQIKNKLQLDFNKNQLVEKLRRLKKKYRTVVGKMSCSGKEFVFKSPHDHATFVLSSKIWSHLSSAAFRGGSGGGGAVDVDDDDPNPNPNPNSSLIPVPISAVTPPRPPNSSYVISQINLNSASPGGGGGSGSGGSGAGFDMMLTNWGGNGPNGGGLSKLCTRKRSRVASSGKAEEKPVKTEGGVSNNAIDNSSISDNNNNNNTVNNVGVGTALQALVEETLKNCLSPVLKDLISNVVNGSTIADSSGSGGGGGGGGGASPGFKGVGALAMNAVPLNFPEKMDEKWRKQQIMELELYSKRLELVQDQIKLSLDELRSMES
ncbi:hypothetical protein RND81_04G022100 [Saponaria officinalis]|uniref:Glabrous enhancer-binding protein-like DBD domain-containing protein n=1 Tax=Saponaria officinalis TaxID=3572 RepID=A0AAW1LGS7_SAPOF